MKILPKIVLPKIVLPKILLKEIPRILDWLNYRKEQDWFNGQDFIDLIEKEKKKSRKRSFGHRRKE